MISLDFSQSRLDNRYIFMMLLTIKLKIVADCILSLYFLILLKNSSKNSTNKIILIIKYNYYNYHFFVGLFHRGFLHSSTALSISALQGAPLEKTKKLAASIGCLNDSSTEFIIACLKERPAQQIVQSSNLFFGIKSFPFAPFGPVVEKKVYDAFLPLDPYEMLLSGQINDVPLINSFTAQEAAMIAAGKLKFKGYLHE